jgi:hypothetical protein
MSRTSAGIRYFKNQKNICKKVAMAVAIAQKIKQKMTVGKNDSGKMHKKAIKMAVAMSFF